MGAKRALIVDDSKSARTFLSRILEKYDIDVDSAENAEQAIEYLGHHRPDVIFMDHMMPGMDGFQAVQAIKNNPRTAMIPIMMYTSQQGELYLGQARALGAVGVLPKQIKPADVSKVLYQLHLAQERRTAEQTSFQAVDPEPDPAPETEAPPPPPPSARPLTDAILREQFAEVRRVLVASLDSQSERVISDVRLVLQDLAPQLPGARPAPRSERWPWAVAGIASALAVGFGLLCLQKSNESRALSAELTSLRQAAAAVAAPAPAPAPASVPEPAVAAATVLPAAASAGAETERGTALPASTEAGSRSQAPDFKPLIESVPYGADPFGGPRLEILRRLFDRLTAANFRGTVEIHTFSGRFCLVGSATDGFSLAPDETVFAKCDAVSGYAEDPSQQAPRITLPFANLMSAFRDATHGAVDVQVAAGDASANVAPYPAISDTLTAGEWNRAGIANNRLEVRVR
jgi:CheY-like chemotaxis protein